MFQTSGRDVLEMYFRIAFHFADVSFCISGGLRGRLEGAWALGLRDPMAPWGFEAPGIPGLPRDVRDLEVQGALGRLGSPELWGLGALGLLGP